MVQLVAEAPGDQFLALGLEPVAVPVLGPDLGLVGPGHQTVLARDAQASFRAGLLPGGLHQRGIHQLQDLLPDIHDHHTAQNAHLRSRQTHAVGFLQRLGHIVQQFVQLLIEGFHRLAHLMQSRILIRQDLSDPHMSSS